MCGAKGVCAQSHTAQSKRMTYALAADGYHFFSSRHLVCHVECAYALRNHFKTRKKKQYTENNALHPRR